MKTLTIAIILAASTAIAQVGWYDTKAGDFSKRKPNVTIGEVHYLNPTTNQLARTGVYPVMSRPQKQPGFNVTNRTWSVADGVAVESLHEVSQDEAESKRIAELARKHGAALTAILKSLKRLKYDPPFDIQSVWEELTQKAADDLLTDKQNDWKNSAALQWLALRNEISAEDAQTIIDSMRGQ